MAYGYILFIAGKYRNVLTTVNTELVAKLLHYTCSCAPTQCLFAFRVLQSGCRVQWLKWCALTGGALKPETRRAIVGGIVGRGLDVPPHQLGSLGQRWFWCILGFHKSPMFVRNTLFSCQSWAWQFWPGWVQIAAGGPAQSRWSSAPSHHSFLPARR